jgi:hypothetical protein
VKALPYCDVECAMCCVSSCWFVGLGEEGEARARGARRTEEAGWKFLLVRWVGGGARWRQGSFILECNNFK